MLRASGEVASTTSSVAATPRTLAGRSGELVNPDDSTMVLLYYDVAGLAPPLADWVEKDSRVQMARPADKAAQRDIVHAELAAAAASLKGIGVVRISMNADLSDYDPTYEEFTVRAFAPSSVVTFSAFGEKVSLRFGNGRDAQTWRVAPADAQTVRDKVSYGSVSVDALLAITAVNPAPKGGTLTANVVEYEMRETLRGAIVGRVQVAAR